MGGKACFVIHSFLFGFYAPKCCVVCATLDFRPNGVVLACVHFVVTLCRYSGGVDTNLP